MGKIIPLTKAIRDAKLRQSERWIDAELKKPSNKTVQPNGELLKIRLENERREIL